MVVPAGAQDYPTHPVRILAGPPGTLTESAARQVGQRLSERWGKPVVVENRATNTVATGAAAQAPADGYTLVMSDRTALAAFPSLQKALGYDPLKDLVPITRVAVAAMVLVAHPSVPAATLREFIEYSKKQPGMVDFATAGPATAPHLANEMLRLMTGINVQSIQYKGSGAAQLAILGGEPKVGFVLASNTWSLVSAGKLKAYAVTTGRRFSGAPEIPTASEAGLPGFESLYWIGMLAPARTPGTLVDRLNRDIVEIVQTQALQAAFLVQGAETAASTPEEFAAFIQRETTKLNREIELTGVRVN
jgi:tripartite-type tricarboxylate transporter receptor subunit TctC